MTTPLWARAGLRSGDRVALIGSGGKTTLLYRLGREAPGRALLTTTTRMWPPRPSEVPVFLEFRGVEEFLPEWEALGHQHALVARAGGEKLRGLEPGEVDALCRRSGADLVAVEADGSRGLPAKGHGEAEPVLFGECTLGLAVLGMHALGARVVEGEVHRPEVLARVAGIAVGAVLDAAALARLLTAPGGYLDRLPMSRRLVALTAIDRPERLEAACVLARRAGVPVLGFGPALARDPEVLA